MRERAYMSGSDITVDFLGVPYSFSTRDFRARVATAAFRLGVVGEARPPRGELEDLVELAARGGIEEPRSLLGSLLAAEPRSPSGGDGGPDLVYWLRKLVWRSAWLDLRVRSGEIEALFDEETGAFRHAADGVDLPFGVGEPVPRWDGATYHG